jgi:hypothetical protein
VLIFIFPGCSWLPLAALGCSWLPLADLGCFLARRSRLCVVHLAPTGQELVTSNDREPVTPPDQELVTPNNHELIPAAEVPFVFNANAASFIPTFAFLAIAALAHSRQEVPETNYDCRCLVYGTFRQEKSETNHGGRYPNSTPSSPHVDNI